VHATPAEREKKSNRRDRHGTKLPAMIRVACWCSFTALKKWLKTSFHTSALCLSHRALSPKETSGRAKVA